MQQRTEMTTLSQVMEKLRQKGVDNEIRMDENNRMFSEKGNKTYTPEELIIFRIFRFEGDTDPSDSSVLYLVEDSQGELGYILDSYGAYSNYDGTEFADFIKKVRVDERDFQEFFE
ncbi:MAG: hypothetical protein QM727_10535 [Niabella sp.]